ncbi:hypothetical protein Tco_1545978 [Tanacetum coccineum]
MDVTTPEGLSRPIDLLMSELSNHVINSAELGGLSAIGNTHLYLDVFEKYSPFLYQGAYNDNPTLDGQISRAQSGKEKAGSENAQLYLDVFEKCTQFCVGNLQQHLSLIFEGILTRLALLFQTVAKERLELSGNTKNHLNTHLDVEDLGFVIRTKTAANIGIAYVPQQGVSLTMLSQHIKTPIILKKERYDIWAMEMEHYFKYIDNDCLEVNQNGNSKKFHGMDDAKEIWEAIRTRFGGNANSKKMQKAVFKQQFDGI